MSEKTLFVYFINGKFFFYDPKTQFTYREGANGFNKWFRVKDSEDIRASILRSMTGE